MYKYIPNTVYCTLCYYHLALTFERIPLENVVDIAVMYVCIKRNEYICLGKCFRLSFRTVQLDKAHLEVFG